VTTMASAHRVAVHDSKTAPCRCFGCIVDHRYRNRAQCHRQLGHWTQVLEDSEAAEALDHFNEGTLTRRQDLCNKEGIQ